jgi:lipoate-protein ligase A
VEVLYGLHKAKGGLIRTAEEISEGEIEDVTISGDFTFYPKESLTGLEGSLEKVPLDEDEITERVETFYEEERVESPGVESKDFAITILSPVQASNKEL